MLVGPGQEMLHPCYAETFTSLVCVYPVSKNANRDVEGCMVHGANGIDGEVSFPEERELLRNETNAPGPQWQAECRKEMQFGFSEHLWHPHNGTELALDLWLYPHPIIGSQPVRFSESDLMIREMGVSLGRVSGLAKRASVGPYESLPKSGAYIPFLTNVDFYIKGGNFSTEFQHYCRIQVDPDERLPAGQQLWRRQPRDYYTQPNRAVVINATHLWCSVMTMAPVTVPEYQDQLMQTTTAQLIVCSGRQTCLESSENEPFGSSRKATVISSFTMFQRGKIDRALSSSLFLWMTDSRNTARLVHGSNTLVMEPTARIAEPTRVSIVIEKGAIPVSVLPCFCTFGLRCYILP